jgi:hypothetical protein
VLLAVNVPTRSILSALKPDSFPSRDPAVGLCSCFQSPGSRLLSFQPSGFAHRKPAAPYALPDAPLLPTLAPIYAWRLLRGRTDPERNHKRDRYQNANDSLHLLLLILKALFEFAARIL